jgi:hypothetical protein
MVRAKRESVDWNEDVLVLAITAHCRDQNHNDQSCHAEMLGITPQGITEIFKGRNNPTGEQVLVMSELMEARR